MQFAYENLQTLRKAKHQSQLTRARSLDQLNFQQLTPKQTKILLSVPKRPTDAALQLAVIKQELLIHKKLFDPFKHFGSPNFFSMEEAWRYHQPRFEAMFTQTGTQRKIVKTVRLERKNSRIEEASPGGRAKPSIVSTQKSRRTVGRSPKSYVKENKENFQKLNINNMQKMRVKLKLSKK